MNSFLDGVFVALIGVLSIAIIVAATSVGTYANVVRDCEHFSRFEHDGQVYICFKESAK